MKSLDNPMKYEMVFLFKFLGKETSDGFVV